MPRLLVKTPPRGRGVWVALRPSNSILIVGPLGDDGYTEHW